MKKLFLLTVVMLGLATSAMAITDTEDFVVSATVPAASGINIVATEVSLPGNTFGSQVTAMDFDPLSFDTANGIWIPNHYFAVDVGATGGAGTPNITVSYGNESNPVGQVKGLGFKSTATFVKITGPEGAQVEEALAAHGPEKLLKDLIGGEDITAAEIDGGFFRVYVGIYTGDDATLNGLGGEPFTNADVAGDYSGTLTISATIP